VIHDGRVLLAPAEPRAHLGWWDVPGGYLEYGEHPENAARREIREETGLEIRLTRLLGVYVSRYGADEQRTLDLIYLAEVIGGEEKPGDDAEEIRWFAPEELPAEVAFDSGPASLRDWVRELRGRA
jgi:ADP-ribose pyrophosphatase